MGWHTTTHHTIQHNTTRLSPKLLSSPRSSSRVRRRRRPSSPAHTPTFTPTPSPSAGSLPTNRHSSICLACREKCPASSSSPATKTISIAHAGCFFSLISARRRQDRHANCCRDGAIVGLSPTLPNLTCPPDLAPPPCLRRLASPTPHRSAPHRHHSPGTTHRRRPSSRLLLSYSPFPTSMHRTL